MVNALGKFQVLQALNLSMGREIQYGGLVSLRHMMDASRQNRYFWHLGHLKFCKCFLFLIFDLVGCRIFSADENQTMFSF